MHILHYSLGFPPYRTGGLTKFCLDLMKQQIKEEHEVSLLWPGRMLGRKIQIKNRDEENGIKSYELINPLPVPYDEGIIEIEAFTKDGDRQYFIQYLSELKPQVIHLHTFMGLYSSFLEAAKDLGIKTVFTTHDFFPICPKVTMYRYGRICETVNTCSECAQCNSTALDLKKIQILQSPIYRGLKNSTLVKMLRKKHRDMYLNETVHESMSVSRTQNDYRQLRKYYLNILQKINVIHYNSSVTQYAYEQVFSTDNYRRIPITHAAIGDYRKKKDFMNGCLQIRYLGPQGGGKGFFY